jgi:hypothetical protein
MPLYKLSFQRSAYGAIRQVDCPSGIILKNGLQALGHLRGIRCHEAQHLLL